MGRTSTQIIVFMLMCAVCSAADPARVYELEEDSGSLLKDSVGGVNGTRNSLLNRVDGVFEGRYSTKCDGANYSLIPFSSDFLNEFTWDFFYKPVASDLVSGRRGILGDQSLGSLTFCVFLINGNLATFISVNGSFTSYHNSGFTLSADTWYHIRISYGTAGGRRISVDGVEVSTSTYIGALYPTSNYGVGNIINYDYPGCSGSIADLRFYNSQLESGYIVPTDYFTPYNAGGDDGDDDYEDQEDILAALNLIGNKVQALETASTFQQDQSYQYEFLLKVIASALSFGLGLMCWRLIILATSKRDLI